jgi:hypothetical protein
MGHYLTERQHQGISSQIIRPEPSLGNDNAPLGAIGRRSCLGGLLNYYSYYSPRGCVTCRRRFF